MADNFVYVVARIKPAEGKVEEVEAGLAELAGLVEKNEPGAISYQFFYNEAESEFAVFEIYKDAEAAAAHKNSAHVAQAIKEGLEGKIAAPPNIQVVKRKGGFRRG